MGFKENLKLSLKYNGSVGQLYITNGKLMWNSGKSVKKYPLAGAVAEFDPGEAPTPHTTMTRVAAGLLIAGPVGAIVGGMFKKDSSRAYINVTLEDGRMLIADVPASKASEARKFAQLITEAGQAYQNLQG